MTVYWQHVGEANAARDFPRTIGTVQDGVVQFTFSDVLPRLNELSAAEREMVRSQLDLAQCSSFQIWGTPSGANEVLRQLKAGDIFMLMATYVADCGFDYVGKVVARLPREAFGFSQHLWTESRFPFIFFLVGGLIDYPWHQFRADMEFDIKYLPRGHARSIARTRLRKRWPADEDYFVYLKTNYPKRAIR